MKKIVINKCYGGFGLSYAAYMKYAELSGFKLYAFTEKRDENGHFYKNKIFIPYNIGDKAFIIHYSKEPLDKDGQYIKDSYFSCYNIPRDDINLVRTVEELGELANGGCAELKVVEVPDDIEWEIDDYDGIERVEEKHNSWS